MATTTENTRYGLNISVPTKSLIRSKTTKILGLNYPIGRNMGSKVTGTVVNKNSTNNYFNSQSNVELIKNNLRQLLLTEKGERVMLPNFGLGLRKFLFEPLDEILVRIIKDHILEGIVKYAKNVKVLGLVVSEDDSSEEVTGRFNILLSLQLRDESREIFDVGVVLK